MMNTHQNHITGSFQSAARLSAVALALLASVGVAQTFPSSGHWRISYGNDQHREYDISPDGSVTWTGDKGATSIGKLVPTEESAFLLDFNDNKIERLTLIQPSELRVEHFNPKAKLTQKGIPLLGKAVLVSATATEPIAGIWKWFLGEQKRPDGVVEIRADGTFTMIGTSKNGTWEKSQNTERTYVLHWRTISTEDSVVLAPDGNGLSGDIKGGGKVFGERLGAASPPVASTSSAASDLKSNVISLLDSTTWDWTSSTTAFHSSVTFAGNELKFGWGGSGTLSPGNDSNEVNLKTTEGASLLMVFDDLHTGFSVKQGAKTVARGTRQMKPIGSAAAPTASSQSLKLGSTWDTPMQGGTATMDDLGKIFGPVAKPNIDFRGSDTTLFESISYLMPVRQAFESLKLSARLPSKVLVACPGFPRDSLYYYAIDGRFEGRYNRMYLVVDRADQVVAVELVDETPPKPNFYSVSDLGWHTYDFVNARSKAISTLHIQHKLALWTTNKFDEPNGSSATVPDLNSKNAGWKLARLDSLLVQKDKNPYSNVLTAKQDTRWYVPRPVVELILHCLKKAGR